MAISLHERAYAPTDMAWIVRKAFAGQKPICNNKGIEYYNVPLAFDIETTSFEDNGEKRATMYAWMLGIAGYCVLGRTWDEYDAAIGCLREALGLRLRRRVVLYVHNLAFEFQFIKDRYDWDNVFALDERKPCYAVTTYGVEYRCSYILSNYSLANVARNLTTYSIRKMEGDLDYSLMRHSGTELTSEEVGYCVNDVLILNAYIQERMDADGNITQIPLTNTGYVRRFCRETCLGRGKERGDAERSYKRGIRSLTLEPDEYATLRRAFQGGFTHGNAMWVGRRLHDVDSYDFTSSYPAVMVAERYPMGKGEYVEISTSANFRRCIDNYCCVFDVEFENLRCTWPYEEYISTSHCETLENPVVNNGRLVQCSHCITTVTDVDWVIIRKMYEWDSARVAGLWRYRRGYLPTSFVRAVLSLYGDKTSLKGVAGREADYLHRKGMLNSCYGMTVTDICRDECTYDKGEWTSTSPDVGEVIGKYNRARGRFLFYPWGVWVTAYARRNLFTGILSVGQDYVYCDTDSLKILHGNAHRDYFERYDEDVASRLRAAMRHHGLDESLVEPRTVDGDPKMLGVWDYEGHYSDFKTLGAKRYLYTEGGRNHLTVAGLGKEMALGYMELVSTSANDLYDMFSNDMYIPRGHTGKSIHTYIDKPTEGIMTDYKGSSMRYSELSALHLGESDYSLSIGRAFLDYIMGGRWLENSMA